MAPEDASHGESDYQIDQRKAYITELPQRLHTTHAKKKLLQKIGTIFKGQQETYNNLEHLFLNHIQEFQIKLSEEEKLRVLLSLFRYDAIELWRALQLSSDTKLQDVLVSFKKE